MADSSGASGAVTPGRPAAGRSDADVQGHWLLARLGKRVLRPGGADLTSTLLDRANVTGADVVEFAVSLQARIDDLHRAVDEVAAALARVDRRVDGALSRSALIRYDAYEDTGGHQSASMALLDSARSGIVLTAIQGRDYARVYVKQLDRGRTPIALSPEEQQAVERAMAAD